MTENLAAPSGTFELGGDLPVYGSATAPCSSPGKESGVAADPDEAIRVLRRAVEIGINFIDTADSYGPFVTDDLIREALHPYPDDLVIATKAGLTRQGPGEWTPVGRPEYLRQQVELSLRRLGLERIDLFQLHRIDPASRVADQVGELAAAGRGQDPHIGLSEVSVGRSRRPEDRRDRLGAEPLQPRRPRRRGRARPLHAREHRLHPVVPAGHRQAVQRRTARWPSGQGARRHPVAAGAGLAAATAPP